MQEIYCLASNDADPMMIMILVGERSELCIRGKGEEEEEEASLSIGEVGGDIQSGPQPLAA